MATLRGSVRRASLRLDRDSFQARRCSLACARGCLVYRRASDHFGGTKSARGSPARTKGRRCLVRPCELPARALHHFCGGRLWAQACQRESGCASPSLCARNRERALAGTFPPAQVRHIMPTDAYSAATVRSVCERAPGQPGCRHGVVASPISTAHYRRALPGGWNCMHEQVAHGVRRLVYAQLSFLLL